MKKSGVHLIYKIPAPPLTSPPPPVHMTIVVELFSGSNHAWNVITRCLHVPDQSYYLEGYGTKFKVYRRGEDIFRRNSSLGPQSEWCSSLRNRLRHYVHRESVSRIILLGAWHVPSLPRSNLMRRKLSNLLRAIPYGLRDKIYTPCTVQEFHNVTGYTGIPLFQLTSLVTTGIFGIRTSNGERFLPTSRREFVPFSTVRESNPPPPRRNEGGGGGGEGGGTVSSTQTTGSDRILFCDDVDNTRIMQQILEIRGIVERFGENGVTAGNRFFPPALVSIVESLVSDPLDIDGIEETLQQHGYAPRSVQSVQEVLVRHEFTSQPVQARQRTDPFVGIREALQQRGRAFRLPRRESARPPPPKRACPIPKVEPAQARTQKEMECLVCMDSARGVVCIPCGHACMCEPCSLKLFEERRPACPVCREGIERTQAIFL